MPYYKDPMILSRTNPDLWDYVRKAAREGVSEVYVQSHPKNIPFFGIYSFVKMPSRVDPPPPPDFEPDRILTLETIQVEVKPYKLL